MNQLTGKITWSSYFTATENEELSVWKLSVRTPKRFHSAFCLALFRQAKSKSLFPFCCLFAANRRKEKGRTDLTGKGVIEKKKRKCYCNNENTKNVPVLLRCAFWTYSDTIWEWMMRGEVDLPNHVTVSVKRRKNTSIFNDLPSLITA